MQIQDIQPSTRPRINISQVPAGKWCISVFSFFCSSRSFLCLFVFMCFFFACKCKSLNRLGEDRKTTERNRNQTEKLREKQIQDIQPTNLREYISYIFSWRFVGWISCISFFLCFYVFLEAFHVSFYVFMSFSIVNAKA